MLKPTSEEYAANQAEEQDAHFQLFEEDNRKNGRETDPAPAPVDEEIGGTN